MTTRTSGLHASGGGRGIGRFGEGREENGSIGADPQKGLNDEENTIPHDLFDGSDGAGGLGSGVLC